LAFHLYQNSKTLFQKIHISNFRNKI